MRFFEFFKKNIGNKARCEKPIENPIQEKESAMISITKDDMIPFNMLPFHFNGPYTDVRNEKGKPCMYMDLDKMNQAVATKELENINLYIRESAHYYDSIPDDLEIPIRSIMYKKYSESYGYSKLKCTPKTKTGKQSKIPLEFVFMTKLFPPNYKETKDGFEQVHHDTTTGELYYGHDGSVLKGKVNFWREGKGYFYELNTVGRTLLITKIDATSSGIVYEFK